MRPILLLLVALLGTLTACGTDSASSEPAPTTATTAPAAAGAEEAGPVEGAWPEEQVEVFVEACSAQAGEEICVCAADVLQAEIGYQELLAQAGGAMTADALPPELLALVVESCL